MDIGLSTYAFPWAIGVEGYQPDSPLTLLDLLQLCEAWEVPRFQIGDNIPIHTLPASEWEEALALADRAGIQLEIGTRRLEENHLRQYLQLARGARSPFLRLVIDEGDYQPGEEEIVRIIRKLLPEFKEARVRLGLENHDRFPALTLRRMVEETNPVWVGICLDTSNSLGAGEGLRHIVPVLGPYVFNLHYKDITIKRVGHKMGFQVAGCCPGTGSIPLDFVLEELIPYGRCQSVTLEQWPPLLNTLAETIAQERAWAMQGVELLKIHVNQISY
ncbi:MAG: sugar phosphate isomerase/epimerase [Bacteroidetes bacterium]|nr:sugar phosphate isomerase/epimerase [Bacteroidota bacterium]